MEEVIVNNKALAHQMECLAHLEAKINSRAVDQEFLEHSRMAAAGKFRLVVMGEIKKGKSSFINALTGSANLVPVHSDVATSTIFTIQGGPEIRYTVHFRKDTGRATQAINATQLDEYGTEGGNPENFKGVESIVVESPSPILRNGLIVVDTPGVGGLFKKHREITFRHAPSADAVFFIIDSIESPIGADEVKFLKELRQITPLITFIQTKSSLVDQTARIARMQNNLTILQEQVGIPKEKLTYFIVDSNLKVEADAAHDRKDLQESGFVPLMTYLNSSLRGKQEVHVARAAMARTMSKLLPMEATLAEKRRILAADTAEDRARIQQEQTDLQSKLSEWDVGAKPRILEAFRKSMTSLTRKAQEDLKALQPSGKLQLEFENRIESASDADEVRVALAALRSDLAALTSAKCIKICDQARNGVTTLLDSLAKDVVGTMGGSTTLQLSAVDPEKLWVNTSSIERIVDRGSGETGFDGLRTAFYGGSAGMTMMAVAGAVIGSVIPVFGSILGSALGMTIGGLFGASLAVESSDARALESLKRESQAALHQAFSSAYGSATSFVNNLVVDMQSEANSVLQKMFVQFNEGLNRSRADLTRRQSATQVELAQARKSVGELTTELEAIRRSLDGLRTESVVS